ncbi:MAG: helix-turn-helix transcriptional regulator [Lachnospiraceae bacterium]|nr:helix-turn-helix transcriptional regulator [Lachnospiraceae bacterium]
MNKIKTGNMIRDARIQKGYTQAELGTLLGVSNKAVSRWENGDSFPDIGVLESLAEILGLGIQDLVVGEHGEDAGNEAIKEVARLAIFQSRDRRRRLIFAVIDIAVLLLSFIYAVLILTGSQGELIGLNCFILFGPLYLLVMVKAFRRKSIVFPFKDKVSRLLSLISLISGLYVIGMMIYLVNNSSADFIPFGLTVNSVGPFLSANLIFVFSMNLLFLLIGGVRIMKEKAELHYGLFLFLFVILITVAFGDSIRSLSSIEAAIVLLKRNLITALIETVIFGVATAIMVVFTKRRVD